MNHNHDAFAAWRMSTSHLCRQLDGFAIVSSTGVETALPGSKHLSTVTATVRSTPNFRPDGSCQCQPCRAVCGCSRSNADPPTGPWGFTLSPRPGSPSLRGSDTHLQHILHCLQVLHRTRLCTRRWVRVRAPGVSHPQPSSRRDLGAAAHPALTANPQAFLCNRVRSGDWRSLRRAEMRLYRKD